MNAREYREQRNKMYDVLLEIRYYMENASPLASVPMLRDHVVSRVNSVILSIRKR